MVPCLPRVWIASVASVRTAPVRHHPLRPIVRTVARSVRQWARQAVALALLASLALGLAGCLAAPAPPQSALLQALALQIQLTQADVAKALSLESVAPPLVSRVRVERQEAVMIGPSPGLRLAGRFDWRLGKEPFRVDAPFEIFLERGTRGESWRLARPAGVAAQGEQEWLTYPLPLRNGAAAGFGAG